MSYTEEEFAERLYEAIGFRSTDSEAMNIVEVMDEVQRICGEQVGIYTGDGHATSRISAGMVFLSHGVVAGLYHLLNGWSCPETPFISWIFDYSSLLEYSKEVPTVGIISSQLG